MSELTLVIPRPRSLTCEQAIEEIIAAVCDALPSEEEEEYEHAAQYLLDNQQSIGYLKIRPILETYKRS
jgi:hypothetical protein